MRPKLGRLTVLPPSQHDGRIDDPDAVAMVYLYGSRGGFRDAQLIGADDASEAVRILSGTPDELPFSVGVTETCERLARFKTAEHAAAFISTLPDHESGIYFLDGPEIPAVHSATTPYDAPWTCPECTLANVGGSILCHGCGWDSAR